MDEPTCSVNDDSHSRGPLRNGMCGKHYMRQYRHGDALTVKPRNWRGTPEERFWVKVDKNGPVPGHRPDLGPCWVWTGGKMTSGYGTFYPGGGRGTPQVGAHRFAYEMLREPIPEGMEIDHVCRNKLCVNAANGHLEPVTRTENLRRVPGSFVAENPGKTPCPKGHPYDEENTRVRVKASGSVMRSCRQCGRDAAGAARDARGGMSVADGFKPELAKRNAAKTHCPQGHEYTPENTFIDRSSNGKNGGRRCRICMRAKSARGNEARRIAKKRTKEDN